MNKLLNAVIASGASGNIQLPSPQSHHGLEVVITGAGTMTALVVTLEGSVSGVGWATLATSTFAAGDMTAGAKMIMVADKMVERVRANITTYTSGFTSMGTLSVDGGGIPASGTTVTIDTKIYKFATTATVGSVEGIVKRGAAAASGIAHLKLAITHGANGSTGNAVKYASAASHPSATVGTLTASALIVRARTLGAAGNSIVTSETSASLSFGHDHLQQGADKGKVTAYYTPYPNI